MSQVRNLSLGLINYQVALYIDSLALLVLDMKIITHTYILIPKTSQTYLETCTSTLIIALVYHAVNDFDRIF